MAFKKMEKDWGELKLTTFNGCDLLLLFNEMIEDQSDFVHNFGSILDAFKVGNLYGLCVDETQEMFDKNEQSNPIFIQSTQYLLPCFCIVDEDHVDLIWTHSRARRCGFARKMVELLNITNARNPLPGSESFWEKCGIPTKDIK